MIAAIVEGVTHPVQGMLDGTNVAEIPPFIRKLACEHKTPSAQ